MANLFEHIDDFIRAVETKKIKRDETRRSDKGKGKEHEHRSGRRSVLDWLSCSRSIKVDLPKRDNFTPLLKFPKEIYALIKVIESLDNPSDVNFELQKKQRLLLRISQ